MYLYTFTIYFEKLKYDFRSGVIPQVRILRIVLTIQPRRAVKNRFTVNRQPLADLQQTFFVQRRNHAVARRADVQ